MKNQINQIFINKLVALTQSILTDEAKFLHHETSDSQTLNSQAGIIFSDQDLSEQNNRNALRTRYFPLERQGVVPFASDDQEDLSDRMFYIKELRAEIREITDNYQNFGLILPESNLSSSNNQTNGYTFRGDQFTTIYKIIFKLCHGFEQRKIEDLEKNKLTAALNPSAAFAEVSQEKKSALPDLGNKILVKGVSGDFNVILTRTELEDMLQSPQRAREIALTKGIPLGKDGQPLIILFLQNDQLNNSILSEIVKRSLLTKYTALSMSQDKISQSHDLAVSPKEALIILQRRAALKAQFDFIKSSGGKIKIIQDVQLDLNGNAFFLGKDQKGDEFRVEVNLKVPFEDQKYKLIISSPEENGINTDFILTLNKTELNDLETTPVVELFEENSQRVIEGQPSDIDSSKTPKIVKSIGRQNLKAEGEDQIDPHALIYGVKVSASSEKPSHILNENPIGIEEQEGIPQFPSPAFDHLGVEQASPFLQGQIRTFKPVAKKSFSKKFKPYNPANPFKKEQNVNPMEPPLKSANTQNKTFQDQPRQNQIVPQQKQPTQPIQKQSGLAKNKLLKNPALLAAMTAGGGLLTGGAATTAVTLFLGT